MTTYTDHGLVCPDDGDYAAIALTMQADAQATDAALLSITNSFNSVYSRPYGLFVTTSGNSVSSGGEQEFNEGIWSIQASRGFSAITLGGQLLGSVVTVTIGKTGWYGYGNYVNLTLVGAATAFSRRSSFARAYTTESGVPTRLDEARWRTVENSVAGGEFLIASGGSFYATAGDVVFFTATWSHANAASNVASQAGALFWVTYTGTGIEIGSA
jgi:hypothetical protein